MLLLVSSRHKRSKEIAGQRTTYPSPCLPRRGSCWAGGWSAQSAASWHRGSWGRRHDEMWLLVVVGGGGGGRYEMCGISVGAGGSVQSSQPCNNRPAGPRTTSAQRFVQYAPPSSTTNRSINPIIGLGLLVSIFYQASDRIIPRCRDTGATKSLQFYGPLAGLPAIHGSSRAIPKILHGAFS